MKWIRLFTEVSKTPSDMESIEASFNKDISDEKFTPTVEFMKIVYNKMNKEFFFNYLPDESEIKFIVKPLGNKEEIGSAPYSKSYKKHEIIPMGVMLNSSYNLTLHGWVEVILHEMIHISDYLLNPDRFYDNEYEPHGNWFMTQGKRFQKFGFNITKYCKLDLEMNDEIDKNEELDEPNLFIVFNMTDLPNKDKIIRILPKDKESAIEVLRKNGAKEASLRTTKNPLSNEIDCWKPGNIVEYSPFNVPFIKFYGPFKREELLDVFNPISEADEDELDKYMKIARTIKGVTKVYRDDDEVVVWLS